METLKLYEQFKELKKDIEEKALEQAAYYEKREDTKCRPLVVIKDDAEFEVWKNAIERFKELAKALCEGDPVRFKPNAKIFNPAPLLLDNVYRCEIRESDAISQRKIKKELMVKRMKNLLEAEKFKSHSSGDHSKITLIQEQLEKMENDDDEFYLVRAGGYKDIRLLIHYNEKYEEPEKYNLSYTGAFIRPQKGRENSVLSLPQESRMLNGRTPKLDWAGVKRIEHSIVQRGIVYSYNSYENMKRRATKK